MARVLAAGGGEACGASAKSPRGVSTATPAQISALVDRGAFASQAKRRAVGIVVPCRRTWRGLIDNATLVAAGINDGKWTKAA